MKMSKILTIAVSFCTLTAFLVGGMAYFAKAKDVEQIELRLDQKILSDQITSIQERIWALEDRNGGKGTEFWTDEEDKAEYRRLNFLLDGLKNKQYLIMEKIGE